MTLEQYAKLDTVSTARRDLFLAALREVSAQASAAREKPTGGRRGRYLTALTLMNTVGEGFIPLNAELFATPNIVAQQNRFNQVCDDLKRPHVTVWEHQKNGRKVLIDYTHPDGEFNFSLWLLKVDHGFTDQELRSMAAERIKDADDIEASEQMDEWIDETLNDPEAIPAA